MNELPGPPEGPGGGVVPGPVPPVPVGAVPVPAAPDAVNPPGVRTLPVQATQLSATAQPMVATPKRRRMLLIPAMRPSLPFVPCAVTLLPTRAEWCARRPTAMHRPAPPLPDARER